MLKIYNSLFREKQDFVPMRPSLGLAQRGAGRGAGGRHSDADILEFLSEAARDARPGDNRPC
jgi:hypothetical protein